MDASSFAIGSLMLTIYFGGLLISLLLIVSQEFSLPSSWYRRIVYFGLSILSLGIAWKNIIDFIQEDRQEFKGTTEEWIGESDLFVKAYLLVSVKLHNWWWSQQLLLFVPSSFIVFMFAEGQRYRVKHLWAYVYVGFFGAISCAFALFLLRISNPNIMGNPKPPKITNILIICAFIGAFSVQATTWTFDYYYPTVFTFNLALLHAILVVPIMFIPSDTENQDRAQQYKNGMRLCMTYLGLACITGLYHIAITHFAFEALYYPTMQNLWNKLYAAFFDNPCQISIR